MICPPCRTKHHDDCKGGTWCDCQHMSSGVNWPLVEKPETVVVPPTTKPIDC
jgi:hypothetical protein